MKLVYVGDSKSPGRKAMRVRVSPRAQFLQHIKYTIGYCAEKENSMKKKWFLLFNILSGDFELHTKKILLQNMVSEEEAINTARLVFRTYERKFNRTFTRLGLTSGSSPYNPRVAMEIEL